MGMALIGDQGKREAFDPESGAGCCHLHSLHTHVSKHLPSAFLGRLWYLDTSQRGRRETIRDQPDTRFGQDDTSVYDWEHLLGSGRLCLDH